MSGKVVMCMEVYFETKLGKLYCGDALEVLKEMPDNSVDAVVTDPPYGLSEHPTGSNLIDMIKAWIDCGYYEKVVKKKGFMNKEWDAFVPQPALWKEVFRVLKPGGHLLSFFGTRSYDIGVLAIRLSGFEIRDMICWIYGEGFPKSLDISKAIDKELGVLDKRNVVSIDKYKGNVGYGSEVYEYEAKKWHGWGTALKPAVEPIVLARKPLSEKNVTRNVLKWGTGGINIDACRIPIQEGEDLRRKQGLNRNTSCPIAPNNGYISLDDVNKGRFPANVILDEYSASELDRQSGISKSRIREPTYKDNGVYGYGMSLKDVSVRGYDDVGGASRFFYVAKAKRDERYFYCYDCDDVFPMREYFRHKDHKVEFHPTVKPLKLIEYLVKLVTPPNGIVLDPFFGTGTTGVACEKLGFRWIGIDVNEIYCKIAMKRIQDVIKNGRQLRLTDFIGGD
jgi:site-specific DNA-methyltransferase (adenine-specific)